MILKKKINNTQAFKNYEQKLESEGFEVDFRIVSDSLVTIQIVGMPKSMQGKGYGSIIMNNLCKLSDQTGITLQLKPAASSTHSRTKLIRFYSHFGFIENKGENKNDEYQYMYRFPKKQLQEQLLLEKKAIYKYGAIILNLSCSKMNSIHSKIDKRDLYEDDTDKYGIEKEQHVTLLYGTHKEVTKDQVKKILDQFEFPQSIKGQKISLFETDERYDVLKFDIEKKYLSQINKKLTSLPYTNEYPDYKPHMTVAFCKKGTGKKYVDMFKDIKDVDCKVIDVIFSHSDKKDIITIKKKESLSEKILKEVINIDRLPEFVAKIKTLERKFENEGCNIDISFRQEQSIQLSKILIPKEKRNEQLGTKFMNELISLADEFGIIITLSASDSFGSNLNRLTKFYQRFGFHKNTGRKTDHRFSDNMIREPKGI